jgi:hypothetical protein
VHALPSSQAVPSGTARLVHLPLVGSHVLEWHGSVAPQVTATVPTQLPAWQAYESHLLLPVHGAPSGTARAEQVPVVGSHEAVWQASAAGQLIGVPTQRPAWQAYVSHPLVPGHGVPSGAG